jgi:mycothiol synthase
VPFGQPATPEPFEVWAKNFIEDPSNNPDTIWIATHNNQWIAMTSLGKQKDHFFIGMTGVQKPYRSMGIAKALKLKGVKHALNTGLEIRTMNDHVNTAMIAMNVAMGFKRHHSRLRFEKNL